MTYWVTVDDVEDAYCHEWARTAHRNAGAPAHNHDDSLGDGTWSEEKWLYTNYAGIKVERAAARLVGGESLSQPNGRANGPDVGRNGHLYETKGRRLWLWVEQWIREHNWLRYKETGDERWKITEPKILDNCPVIFAHTFKVRPDVLLLGWTTAADFVRRSFTRDILIQGKGLRTLPCIQPADLFDLRDLP